MKQKLLSLCAMLLTFTLLTGCSDDSMNKIGSFLTGKEIETEEKTEEQPQKESEMASEAVMSEAEAPDVLRLAYQESYGLNPFTTASLNNRAILSLLYEPLFVIDNHFQAEPVLATTVEVSEDGRTTTVSLRSDVRFHSGIAMTAGDVVYSYEQAKASSYYGNRFYHVESVEAADPHTIVIHTKLPYENVVLLFDFPIIHQGTGEDPIPDGTGPFVYQDDYQLPRFEHWWRDNWTLDYESAVLTPCSVATDIRDRFEYGEVNLVCTDPSSAAYATYHSDLERWSAPTTIMQYIGFNQNTKVFGIDAIRAAVTYAIDRDAIVSEDLGGFGIPTTLPVSPLSPLYNPGLAADYDYDINAFYSLLDTIEVEDYLSDGILDVYVKDYSVPIEGTMIVNSSSNQRVATANRIAEVLRKVGFNITVKPLDEDEYRTALKYQNFDLYFGEIRMSPNFDLGSFFRDYGSANYGGAVSGNGVSLCSDMLENSGNAYNLHKWVMDKGIICPILFKSYAVYTARGAAQNLNPALDWVIH